ncbi:hypothetical protein [Pleomorphomonas oryzae]|uniref:hypothetical protein n=1 Tax=Pleomorphomonas oryzae TaxID=261934 RepID=UPI000403A42C|nr:hypothetical protein [Pleomorphomonas oryzae]
MADDFQRLAVLIEANTKSYERAMVRLEQKTDKALKGVKTSLDGTGRSFDAFSAKISSQAMTTGKAIAAGLVGGLAGGLAIGSIAALPQLVSQVTGSLDDLQTEAEKLKLPVEELQRWQFAAAETDVTNEQLEGAFTSLTRKIGDAARDVDGPANQAFSRLGINVLTASGSVKSMTQIVMELSAAISAMPTQEERFAAMFALAKENGAELVRLLEGGPDAIKEMMRRADDLGIVIDSELVQRGADLNRQFEIVTATVSTKLKVAIVEAAAALQAFLNMFPSGGISLGLGSGSSTAGGKVGAAAGAQLDARAKAAKALAAALTATKGDLPEIGDWSNVRASASADNAASLAKLAADQKAAADRKAYDAFENYRNAAVQQQANKGTTAHDAEVKAAKAASRSGSRSTARDPYADEVKHLEQSTQAMQAYGDMLIRYNGNADRAQVATDLLSAAFKKGSQITPEMQGAIDALSLKYDEARQRSDDLYDSSQRMTDLFNEMNDTGKDLLGGFISDLRAGKSETEALTNALDRLIDKAMDSALDGLFNMGGQKNGGLFGTLFNGLFGGLLGGSSSTPGGIGHRDGGGSVYASHPYQINERRNEIFVPDTSGKIRRPGDAGFGGPSITYAPTIDARGADASAVARLERAMQADRKAFAKNVLGVQKVASMRRTVV